MIQNGNTGPDRFTVPAVLAPSAVQGPIGQKESPFGGG
jgi:hypothetical protein